MSYTEPPALAAHRVGKTYPARAHFRALHEVCLQVHAGECLALVGVNGAGKTTLIKAFLNLTPINQGSLRIFGIDAGNRHARAHLAYLPEKFAPHAWLKTRDYIALTLSLHSEAFDIAATRHILGQLGLSRDVLNLSFRECSKGMGQKIGLAAAVLSKRRLLILDEPMSGLDPISRVEVKNLLLDLRAQGRTIFMCTHALGDVGELADRLAVMHEGQIRFAGTVDAWCSTYDTQDLEQAFLLTLNAPLSKIQNTKSQQTRHYR